MAKTSIFITLYLHHLLLNCISSHAPSSLVRCFNVFHGGESLLSWLLYIFVIYVLLIIVIYTLGLPIVLWYI